MKKKRTLLIQILTGGVLAIILASTIPSEAVDTLRVTSPDPVLEQWRWRTYGPSSGLAGVIREITEDRDGNIWFATDRGAQRYDGRQWITYTTENGLAHNEVRTVYQTRDGTMWFGTFGGGISRFDGETWTTYTTADGLPSNVMWSHGLHQARDGTLWAGLFNPEAHYRPPGGISRFDGQGWTTIEAPVGLPRPLIMDIHETSDGSLWFLTWGRQGVYRYDGANWTRYTTDDGLAGNNVIEMLESRDGSLWFTCWGRKGISRFDGKQWRIYTSQDGLPEGVDIGSIWQTVDGTVWAGSHTGALCRFDGTRWKYLTPEGGPQTRLGIYARPARDGSLWIYGFGGEQAFRFDYPGAGSMAFAFEDRLFGGYPAADGSVWFATPGGAVRYDGKHWLRYTSKDGLLDAPIYRTHQAADGSLWFFAGEQSKFQGLSQYHNGTWWRYTKDEIGLDYVPRSHQQALRAADGSFWVVGSRNGASAASRYDGQTWRIYTLEDGLVGKELSHIYQADNGDLWFGTTYGNPPLGEGLLRFDGEHWTSYTTQDGLAHNRIYNLTQTPDGTVWAGTLEGVSWFDGNTWRSYTHADGLPARKPQYFAVHNGDLWIAYQASYGAGVTRYDGKTWKTYTTQEGLRSNAIQHIYPSLDGDLWFGTWDGVSRFDGKNWTNYTEEDGLPGRNIYGIWQTPDQTFWFKTADGKVGTFSPDKKSPETTISSTLEEVSSVGNILLRWSGKDLWDDTRPEDLHYQWRMDRKVWSPGSNRTDFTFTSLSSGRHRFEVRAIDRDLNVDPTPAVHAFVVEAPWWKNPWVLGGTVVLLGLVGVQTVRVVRRDRALKRSLETQLLQASRLVSLGEMTAGVAHELGQPLNAVSTAAEDIYLRLSEGMGISEAELKPIMQDVLGMVERMSDTIDHLRVFARDKLDEPRVVFDVNQVVHSGLNILGTQLNSHGVQTDLNLTEGLPQVNGHPHQIEQVLLNLLGNARDALDERKGEGEKRVRIQTQQENGQVVLEVADNGIGMDEEAKARVFEPFFTTKEAERGTGLGLSISYAIVHNHGGTIGCESQEGEGTMFRVTLPVAEDQV